MSRFLALIVDAPYWVRVALNDPAFWAGWVIGGMALGLYLLGVGR